MAEESDAKSFTSWKMDWVNALMIGVGHREFHVAVCLLQHANRQTKLIMPSQHRVATLLGCSVSAVERAIAVLVKAGWLERARRNRQRSNHYQFVEAKRMAMIDLRQLREDDWAAIRSRRSRDSEPAEVTGQKLSDPAEVTGPEPSEVTGRDPAEVTGKHLNGTPEGNTLIVGHDAELSVGQYTREAIGEGLAKRATQERRSKQALHSPASQVIDLRRSESAAPVGTKPYSPPDFDSMEIEQSERRAKARRREYSA